MTRTRAPGRTCGSFAKVSGPVARVLMCPARIEAPGKPGLGQPFSSYQPATPAGGARMPSSSSPAGTSFASTSSPPPRAVTMTRFGLAPAGGHAPVAAARRGRCGGRRRRGRRRRRGGRRGLGPGVRGGRRRTGRARPGEGERGRGAGREQGPAAVRGVGGGTGTTSVSARRGAGASASRHERRTAGGQEAATEHERQGRRAVVTGEVGLHDDRPHRRWRSAPRWG